MYHLIKRLFGKRGRTLSPACKKQFAELAWLQTGPARTAALDDLTRARLVTPTPLFGDQPYTRGAD